MAASPLPVDDATAYAVGHALKLHGFFPEFTAEHLQKLFPRSAHLAFEDGDPLVTQGESGRDIFVLLEGKAAVRQELGSAAAEVAAMGPGDILGEIGLLGDGVRSATVVCVGKAKAFRLAAQDLGYILANHAELAAHLKALASQRTGR